MMKKLFTGKRAGVISALLLSLVVLFGVQTKVSAQEIVPTSGMPQNQLAEGCGIAEHSPQPKIEVDFWNNSIIMKNWFLSPSVDLYIDQVFIESGYLIRGIFSSLQSTRINTGDVITLQSDTYSTTYIVGVLKTTSYDRDSRVLTGIASPGELVVTLPGNPEKNIILQVGQSGVWTFTIPDEISIGSGTRIKLTQFDRKGNSLTNQYLIGYPSFTFYKGEGVIGSSNWPPLTSIMVKVNDQVLDTVLTDGYGSITYSAHYDFVIGDVIRLSGSGYSIDHTIGQLSVDTIDVANNFIAGKALPGSLHVSDRPLYAGMDVEVDANGNWQAYFTESNPWEEDVSGYLQQCQPQHGCQHLWWNNPQHLIAVDSASDQVEANRWEPYSDLQITIASQTWNVISDYSGNAKINTGTYDIIGGDLVTITDGVRTKNYIVTNMTISNVDPINRLVEGTADPNTSVLIYKSNSHNDPWETVTVDSTGNWQFVFRDDIFPDTTVFVKQTDSAGNMTQIVWKYGSPTIWAYPNDNIVIGRNWTANLPVTLTIESQTWTQTPDANGLVEFDLGSFNLEPNQVLEMSNSVQSQSYQTREIYITSIKAFTSVVSGFVNSNSVIVKACAPLYYGCFFRTANTDGNGNWQADFKPDLRFNSEYYAHSLSV